MTGGDADIWVCGQCRSVNKLRAKQCYNCRTPKDRAEVDPTAIEGTGHGQLREIALPEFNSSRGEAMLASVLVIFVAGMNVVSTVVSARVLSTLVDDPGVVPTGLTGATAVSLATLGIGLLALTAWAFWLSRVVSAMPALGLGYPAANAMMAFIENYLPGLNLFRVPAIVRDVVRRLDPDQGPGQGRGEALIFAAWIGLLGGFFVPRIGGLLGFGSDTLEGAVNNALLISGVAAGLVLIGAIFLVVLIWWIEGRIARRRAEQLGEGAPASAETGSAAAAGPGSQVAADEPRLSTPVGTPTPYDPRAAPFAPARQTVATPEPAAPPAPFAPTPGASMPVSQPMVAGPLGAVPATPTTAELLHRPITAVTGAASIPTGGHIASPSHETPEVERFADAGPTWPEPPAAPVAPETPTAADSTAAPFAPPEPARFAPPQPASFAQSEAPADPAPAAPPQAAPMPEAAPPARVPTGPRLHVKVNSATSMIATLDGESEAISIQELRAAADALARADGSAVVASTPTNFDARRLAQQVFEMLSAAQVPTTMED